MTRDEIVIPITDTFDYVAGTNRIERHSIDPFGIDDYLYDNSGNTSSRYIE